MSINPNPDLTKALSFCDLPTIWAFMYLQIVSRSAMDWILQNLF